MKKLTQILIVSILFIITSSLYGQEPSESNYVKDLTIQYIESIQGDLIELSDSIWSFAEIGLEEYNSSKCLADYAEINGFTVERDISGMPTAFIASYGTGTPIIGIFSEYDALPGLSQKVLPQREALIEDAPGHGCGHNLIGTGGLGAAMAIKNLMEKGLVQGTIRLYGAPAEENQGGKQYMARDGQFNDLDVCLDWHPSDRIKSITKDTQGVLNFTFKFKGQASHAGGAPWDGKSALDGVESFLDGINLLREHIKPTVRIHYVITRGGEVPNVVPENAEVWLWVRDIDMENLLKMGERVKEIAKGAALIAGVEHEVVLNGGLYNSLKNKKGAEVLQSNIDLLGPIEYTKEETEFAYKIQDAFGVAKTGMSAKILSMTEALNDPLTFASDVGDVSWNLPEISLATITVPQNIPMHTWGVVACGGMSIGHKGMIYSSKALALTTIDLYMNPDLILNIRKEFVERKGSHIYKAMIPDGPPPLPNKN